MTEILVSYHCDCNQSDEVTWGAQLPPTPVVPYAEPTLLPTLHRMSVVCSASLAGTEAQILPETAC